MLTPAAIDRRHDDERPDKRVVLHLDGIPVASDDAAWLVEKLYQDAASDAIAAALVIENGIEYELNDVALATRHRDAILRQLEDAPEGPAELRRVLARDHRVRGG